MKNSSFDIDLSESNAVLLSDQTVSVAEKKAHNWEVMNKNDQMVNRSKIGLIKNSFELIPWIFVGTKSNSL